MQELNLPTDAPGGKGISAVYKAKRTASRALKSKLNLIMGMFIVLVVVVILTTDLQLTSILDIAAIGLMLFVLAFGSYLMYINSSSAGSKNGLETDLYKKAKERHNELRQKIIDAKLQGKLPEFCSDYVREELKNTRESILTSVGMSYESYEDKWLGEDKKTVSEDDSLSEQEKKIIIAANSVEPIALTADMIFKSDRRSEDRSPLGVNPHKAKLVNYTFKLVQIFAISAVPSVVVLEVSGGFSWAKFASMLLKLLPMVSNAFLGYEFGFKNIVVDTVNYLNDQSDLMCQFLSKYEKEDGEDPSSLY